MSSNQRAKRAYKYPDEFKSAAVQMSLVEGVLVNDVAKSLDIHPFMLSKWRKEYREGLIIIDKRRKTTAKTVKLSQVKSLEAEVARLKRENSLLKKWQRFQAEKRKKDTDSSQETEN